MHKFLRKGKFSMTCTEVYKEHIMYTFNGFCKVVIRYAAINAWRERNRRRQREISFEYAALLSLPEKKRKSSTFIFSGSSALPDRQHEIIE